MQEPIDLLSEIIALSEPKTVQEPEEEQEPEKPKKTGEEFNVEPEEAKLFCELEGEDKEGKFR